ncbi:MAG: hypothetical protein HC822_00925 [Oscillochloris sp.]|nr:hypothetical protein [Oscillochloris sp.]
MSSEALRLIVCTFDAAAHPQEAHEAVGTLRRHFHADNTVRIAVVQRDRDGRIHFEEPGDPREALSDLAATFAGGIAWFVGAFAGMLGPQSAAAAERLTDVAVHRVVRDAGFPDSALYTIGQALHTGGTALVALVPADQVSVIAAELERLGGERHEHDLPPQVVAQLRAGAPEDS